MRRINQPTHLALLDRFGDYVPMANNGWTCECGNVVSSHLLTCPKCKRRLSLDQAVTGVAPEPAAPPIEQWVKEEGQKREYSAESMEEILAQARKREKNSKRARRGKSVRPVAGSASASPTSLAPWLITIGISVGALLLTYSVDARTIMSPGWVSYSLIGFISVISILAFNNAKIIQRYVDNAQAIKRRHEYYRLLSSGVLHANALHLIINMYTLYSFGPFLESQFRQVFSESTNSTYFLAFYMSAMVVSNIPSYLRHRNDRTPYSSLGASGAICAVIGAAVLVNPRATLLFMGFIPMPAIVFFIGFLAISQILAKRAIAAQRPSIVNHSAHITGSIYGFLLMALIAYSVHIDPIANFLHPNF